MPKQNDELQANIDKATARYKEANDCSGMSEEQIRFEAMLDRLCSVSKKELDRRLAEEKKQKDAKGLKMTTIQLTQKSGLAQDPQIASRLGGSE